MLLIILITLLIAALAIPPCLNATIRVFSKFGALGEKSYNERIWHQILKAPREGKNAVREFRRCERDHMFRCLVICTNLVKIYYVHARARYILLSLITCVRRTQPLFSATILRPGHVRGVEWIPEAEAQFSHVPYRFTRPSRKVCRFCYFPIHWGPDAHLWRSGDKIRIKLTQLWPAPFYTRVVPLQNVRSGRDVGYQRGPR